MQIGENGVLVVQICANGAHGANGGANDERMQVVQMMVQMVQIDANDAHDANGGAK